MDNKMVCQKLFSFQIEREKIEGERVGEVFSIFVY